jgi:hypothetical protein
VAAAYGLERVDQARQEWSTFSLLLHNYQHRSSNRSHEDIAREAQLVRFGISLLMSF